MMGIGPVVINQGGEVRTVKLVDALELITGRTQHPAAGRNYPRINPRRNIRRSESDR